ncbi:MAG: LysM peptidoglycan-binding domain-containing protein [Deltaproteobacteria bacterium]|nr:LysM peptidoglycan-binding domain-containing protein [Deltaproteobacteria bacterium]
MALHFTIIEEKNMVILDIAGRIDTFSIDELNDGFDKVMKTGIKNVLLIMKDLEYINSRGIGTLISFLKWVKKVGGLVKIAEVPVNILQVLNFIGLDGLTLIYESVSDARTSFQREQTHKEDASDEVKVLREGHMPVFPQPTPGKSHGLLWFSGIVAALIVIGLMLFFLDRGRDKSLDFAPLVKKLDTLEQRLKRLEEYGQESKDIVKEVTGLKESVSGRVNALANDVDRLKKHAGSLPKPKRETVSARATISSQKQIPRYHRVREGEYLYAIGKRYGISVKELCRLNNIKQNKYIRPGQKLVIGYVAGSTGESPPR